MTRLAVDINGAAELLSVHVNVLREWERKGEMPKAIEVNGQRRWLRARLAALARIATGDGDGMSADWKTNATRLLRECDPEFARTPIYLLDSLEVEASIGNAVGVYSPVLDLQFRPLLKQRGEWVSRGFAAAVAATSYQRLYASLGAPPSDAQLRNEGVSFHEACHYIVAPSLRKRPACLHDEAVLDRPEIASVFDNLPFNFREPRVLWEHHCGIQFGRVARSRVACRLDWPPRRHLASVEVRARHVARVSGRPGRRTTRACRRTLAIYLPFTVAKKVRRILQTRHPTHRQTLSPFGD